MTRSPSRSRTIHLLDVENLCETPLPAEADVRSVRRRYEATVDVDPSDHVVLASSHLAAPHVGFGWDRPGARRVWRSGCDGADMALIGVIWTERVAERFDHVVVASGDGIFAEHVGLLIEAGIQVTVVAVRESLSRRLGFACGGQVEYLRSDPGDEPAISAVAA
ncbi:MAG: hypothetical protein RIE08_03580 [Acidimicrobiales bacterium]